MHIADGVLSPEVCLGAGVLTSGFVGYSLYRLRDKLTDRTIPLIGVTSSVIFAGQMINFPLGFAPVSGHLMGGVIAGALLGPWGGCLALTLVLTVQCLLFADGGLLSLGANILNMGVIGSIGGWAISSFFHTFFRDPKKGRLISLIVSSWLTVIAASTLFCLEFWLSWRSSSLDFGKIFSLMFAFHSVIGIGEAIITGGLMSFLLAERPNLVLNQNNNQNDDQNSRHEMHGGSRIIIIGVMFSLVVVAFLAPFASAHPDGLEAVSQKAAFDNLATEPTVTILDDYELPLPVLNWENSALWQKVSVSLAGILGVAVVLMIGWLFTRTEQPRPSELSETSHAE